MQKVTIKRAGVEMKTMNKIINNLMKKNKNSNKAVFNRWNQLFHNHPARSLLKMKKKS